MKLNQIKKVVVEARGSLPDILALSEVENENTISKLATRQRMAEAVADGVLQFLGIAATDAAPREKTPPPLTLESLAARVDAIEKHLQKTR